MQVTSLPTVQFELPPEAFEGDVPLVAVERGPYVGSLHRGIAAVSDADGNLVVSLGDTSQPVFLRSAAKPFQVMPAILTGAVDRFAVTDRELAVLSASHSAQERHTSAILGILERAGLTETALRCGVHPPLHEPTARARARAGLEPSPVCNNCSGAHTGMLLASVAAGWPLDTYGQPDHPLQVLTRETVGAFSGLPVEQVTFAVDNCAVPTFRLPLASGATAFARLATGQGVSDELGAAAARVRAAMMAHPEMVAGDDRFDTDLMRTASGTIVCKGGAEGFQGFGLLDSGLGGAVKISDGNARAVAPVTMRLLEGLHAVSADMARDLQPHSRPEVRNHLGDPVGRLVAVFRVGERE